MQSVLMLFSLCLTAKCFGEKIESSEYEQINKQNIDKYAPTQRFYAFRYEITGKVIGVGFRLATKEKAVSLGCFGWTQNTKQNSVVGEARCNKENGPLLQEWLKVGPSLATVEDSNFKVYEDTKIRFHFSHFRILQKDEKETCFDSPPHKCGSEEKQKDEL